MMDPARLSHICAARSIAITQFRLYGDYRYMCCSEFGFLFAILLSVICSTENISSRCSFGPSSSSGKGSKYNTRLRPKAVELLFLKEGLHNSIRLRMPAMNQ
ncbi:uncharacterized protein LOC122094333 [Macadamia integrifolia]|uniref:uncharacterized protein LOC122094333 n=1 Tax=Macadamia integrifolia TaxID=60698 RepID=UPI001C532A06|nr:uncharacterized protein LOC122094333 [Macadamia integrifolia]